MGTEQDPDKGRETQELWRELCVCARVVMISSATFLNIAEHRIMPGSVESLCQFPETNIPPCINYTGTEIKILF